MKTDIQIAQEAVLEHIETVAQKMGIDKEYLELYGKYKAKLSEEVFDMPENEKKGKLVLVTAINPTPSGEGKTTMTIGLSDALNKLGKKSIAALREPSLGPCMGMKGGAAGGGYAQVVPMEDINLHFTGDIHAITVANNLLTSMLDNHIHHGNSLQIDTRKIVFNRVLDLNDRSLRNIVIGMGGKVNGFVREDHFQLTVASEVMAILCLAEDIEDLKLRLAKIIVAYTYNDEPVTAGDLKAEGAVAALLKDAIKPNLVQTLEHNPAIIHGGPFANIAHGCNSVRATKLALKFSDIAVTEAGFGADLGAEKFFDIKCRMSGLSPDAVVLVATVRALKHHGKGILKDGISNLQKHIKNLKKYNVPIIVTLNHFVLDTPEEIEFIKSQCEDLGVKFAVSYAWAKGGDGGTELAQKVIDTLEENKADFTLLYDDDKTIKQKIEIICKDIYGASNVKFERKAELELKRTDDMQHFPVCIAKTQYSFSDNPNLLGSPENFDVTVKDIKIRAGAGFIVALLGDIMVMPGLPKVPSAEQIDIDSSGVISGLF